MLANPFKRKAAAPERIPSDEVISLHWLDDNAIFRNSILNLLMTFDGVLDPERLRQSLAQLASRRDGWRKLGARLRLNVRAACPLLVRRFYKFTEPDLH